MAARTRSAPSPPKGAQGGEGVPPRSLHQCASISAGRASPDISHSLCLIEQFARRFVWFCAGELSRGADWRESFSDYFWAAGEQRGRGLGGPWDDAAVVTRCGAACQAGGARGLAATSRRTAAQPQSRAIGHPDAIAILMRRTLMRTRAPILRNLRRIEPQVASANCV